MDKGFIMIQKNLLNSHIWMNSTGKQCKILITLLKMACYKENEWEWKGEKFTVKPGQFVTSLDSIAKHCGKDVTIQNIRTTLVKLEKLGFLTNESTKTGRLITIVNWRLYQGEAKETNKESNSQLTNNQQTTNKQLTPIYKDNKDYKDNKEINIIYSAEFEKIWNMYPEKLYKHESYKMWQIAIKEKSIDDVENAIKNYINDCQQKKRFLQNLSRFLGPDKTYESYINFTATEAFTVNKKINSHDPNCSLCHGTGNRKIDMGYRNDDGTKRADTFVEVRCDCIKTKLTVLEGGMTYQATSGLAN